MIKIFLSYTHQDTLGAAHHLRSELELAGFTVWRESENMRDREVWKEQLRAALREADAVLALLSPASVASEYVRWEWENALSMQKRVIPLLMTPCAVPEELKQLHYHDLSDPNKYSAGFSALIRDLVTIVVPRSAQGTQSAAVRSSKYTIYNANQSAIGDNSTVLNTNPSILDTSREEADIKLERSLDAYNQQTMETQAQSISYPPSPSVDVGIIIALKEEFTEFYNEIKTRCKSLRDEETGRYYYLFEHTSADLNHQYHCVATFVGEMGSVKASLITQRLINQWKPRTLVMLGIAAALSNDVHIGDVVIANQVDAYLENSKAIPTTGGKRFDFTLSGEVYRSSSDLLHAVQNFEFVYGEIFQDWRVNCMRELQQLVPKESLEQLLASKQLRFQVQMIDGHLASGPTVGAAPAFKDWLKKRDRKYLALEMEAGGLMAAAYEQADPKRTLVLRGISDDGDEQKKKLDDIEDGAFRRYAMRNVIHLLWRFFDAGILPHNKPQNSPMMSESGAINSTVRYPAAKIEEAKVSAPMAQTHRSTGISKPSRTSAFISYSHKDKKYLDELHVHLAQYVRMGVVDFWDDTKIPPGSKWHEEIKKALQLAKVAVLLVSADFLASDFIATDELPPLLVAAEQEGAIILPVILRPCAFKDTNLAQFQAVNAPSNPLSNMTRGKREEVWTKVAELIKGTLNIQS